MEPSGMRIPEDASLRYEYISPIGECLFPCSAPTVCARGAMPACRWLPAPALELRRGRSPWRPRLPRPGQVAHVAPFPLHLLAHLQHIHFNFHAQFRLATASTCLGLGCLSTRRNWIPRPTVSAIQSQCLRANVRAANINVNGSSACAHPPTITLNKLLMLLPLSFM